MDDIANMTKEQPAGEVQYYKETEAEAVQYDQDSSQE